jgi:hypothetical protein
LLAADLGEITDADVRWARINEGSHAIIYRIVEEQDVTGTLSIGTLEREELALGTTKELRCGGIDEPCRSAKRATNLFNCHECLQSLARSSAK